MSIFPRIGILGILSASMSQARENLTLDLVRMTRTTGPSVAGRIEASVRPQSQQEMNQAARDRFARLDAEVTAVYEKQLKVYEGSPAVRDALIASQKAWLAYREADGLVVAEASRGGSGLPAFVKGRMNEITQQRIDFLKREGF